MPGLIGNPNAILDPVAHVIQVALTPVFLLSGIGSSGPLSFAGDEIEHLGGDAQAVVATNAKRRPTPPGATRSAPPPTAFCAPR
jgi:hypothetical protein